MLAESYAQYFGINSLKELSWKASKTTTISKKIEKYKYKTERRTRKRRVVRTLEESRFSGNIVNSEEVFIQLMTGMAYTDI
jgi:hypothetical protein